MSGGPGRARLTPLPALRTLVRGIRSSLLLALGRGTSLLPLLFSLSYLGTRVLAFVVGAVDLFRLNLLAGLPPSGVALFMGSRPRGLDGVRHRSMFSALLPMMAFLGFRFSLFIDFVVVLRGPSRSSFLLRSDALSSVGVGLLSPFLLPDPGFQ